MSTDHPLPIVAQNMPETSWEASPAQYYGKGSLTACDQCFHRKIKCHATQGASSKASAGSACIACEKADITCTWSRTAQRRGRKRKDTNPVIQPRSKPYEGAVQATDSGTHRRDLSSSGTAELGIATPRMPWDPLSGTDQPADFFSAPFSQTQQSFAISPQHPGEAFAMPQEPSWPWELGLADKRPTPPQVMPMSASDIEPASPGSAAWAMLLAGMSSSLNTLGPPISFEDSFSEFLPAPPTARPVHINWHSVDPSDHGDAESSTISPSAPIQTESSTKRRSLAAESVVRAAAGIGTDPALMASLPPFPESKKTMRDRLPHLFDLELIYLPMLHLEEFLEAFDSDMQDRSIHFRALLLSILAMNALRRGNQPMEDTTTGPGSIASYIPMDEHVRLAYIRDAQRANSLTDSEGLVTVASVVTPLHLFLGFEWANDHDRSWDCLQQALVRAQKLCLDHLSLIGTEEGENGAMCDGVIREPEWWVSRLRLYYLLVLLERAHALIRNINIRRRSPLRLPGRPWQETTRLRSLIPSYALNGLQVGHVRSFDLVDDKWILCRLERTPCRNWSADEAAALQEELGAHLDDVINGHFSMRLKDELAVGGQVNNILTIAWLRDSLYQVCLTHSFIDPASHHRSLRPSFVSDNLRQAILGPTSKRLMYPGISTDVSGDNAGKLNALTMNAIKTLEMVKARQSTIITPSSSGPRSASDAIVESVQESALVRDLTFVIFKGIGLLLLVLVHAAARAT